MARMAAPLPWMFRSDVLSPPTPAMFEAMRRAPGWPLHRWGPKRGSYNGPTVHESDEARAISIAWL